MCCTRLAGNAEPNKSPKIPRLRSIAQLCRALSSQVRHVSTIGRKHVKQQCLPTYPHNMVNFGPLAAEICWRLWGTPANFNGFRILALLHDTLVVGVSQTLPCWTEGATCIRQEGQLSRWALAHILVLVSVNEWKLYFSSLIFLKVHSCGDNAAS